MFFNGLDILCGTLLWYTRGMESMAKHPRLHFRNGIYYILVKVPEEIRSVVGKSEIKRSLGTKDHKEALKKISLESVKVDEQFDRAR